MAGVDLNPGANDINITFNSAISGDDLPARLAGTTALMGMEGTKIELLPVVLHELGHGLGFATITLAGVQTGHPPALTSTIASSSTSQPGTALASRWCTMRSATASAQNCSNVVWDGARVVAASQATARARSRFCG